MRGERMWLIVIAGLALGAVALFCLIYLIQELDAWFWHWRHYTLPDLKTKREWRKRYRDFERRNRWNV